MFIQVFCCGLLRASALLVRALHFPHWAFRFLMLWKLLSFHPCLSTIHQQCKGTAGPSLPPTTAGAFLCYPPTTAGSSLLPTHHCWPSLHAPANRVSAVQSLRESWQRECGVRREYYHALLAFHFPPRAEVMHVLAHVSFLDLEATQSAPDCSPVAFVLQQYVCINLNYQYPSHQYIQLVLYMCQLRALHGSSPHELQWCILSRKAGRTCTGI